MENQNFAWHVHHDRLIEPLMEPIEARIAYIKANKPQRKIKLWLQLLAVVKGELPIAVVETGREYAAARRVFDEARQVDEKAEQAYHTAWRAISEVRYAYCKAWRAYEEAEQIYYAASHAHNEALKEHNSEILALHTTECPNCPWNGKTIFKKLTIMRGWSQVPYFVI